MSKVLIVEDDAQIRSELEIFLKGNGYEVDMVTSFENTLDDMLSTDASLILLDINIPYVDGTSVLKMFRKQKNTPVIMVTSKNTDMDELLCMSYGADDYVTKPYNPAILLFHIEAVLRRFDNSVAGGKTSFMGIEFDTNKDVLMRDGRETSLTKNEAGILKCLLSNKGKIVSRDEIMSYLWDSCEFVDDNTLTVNITRIRKKLSDFSKEDIIKTKRGQGYYIEG